MYSDNEKINMTWGDLKEALDIRGSEQSLDIFEEIHLRNEAIKKLPENFPEGKEN